MEQLIQEVDRASLIESLVFMTGHGYQYFSKMTDVELQQEYDRKMK